MSKHDPRPAPTLRLLHVEDSPSDANLTRELLADETTTRFSITWAPTLAEATASLKATPDAFDLILLDLGLPDSQGLETLAQLLQHSHEIPVVVLTGLDDKQKGIEAVHLGAEDYLGKQELAHGDYLSRTLIYAANRAARRSGRLSPPALTETTVSEQAQIQENLPLIRRKDPELFDALVDICLGILEYNSDRKITTSDRPTDALEDTERLVSRLNTVGAGTNDLLEVYSTAVRRYTALYPRDTPRDSGLLLHMLSRINHDTPGPEASRDDIAP